jgi:RNA methyltransferase, TrmH family
VQRITSRQNAVVARYRAAARGEEPRLALVDGAHLVSDALAANLRFEHIVVAAEAVDRGDVRPLVHAAERKGISIAVASAPVIAAVSPVRSPSVVVALVERPQSNEARIYRGGEALVVVACDVQDPGNVGAIARVAEAAGATGLIAAGQSADPLSWKALRGSMGSALRLPIVSDHSSEHALARARHHGCRILATAPRGGRSLFEADLRVPVAVVIGGEGAGLPGQVIEAADEAITIPMEAPVESLNAAVTAALLLYEARRRRTSSQD